MCNGIAREGEALTKQKAVISFASFSIMPRSSSSLRGFDDINIADRRSSVVVLRRMSSVWRRASGSYGPRSGRTSSSSRSKLRLASRFGLSRTPTDRPFVPPEDIDTHAVTSVLSSVPGGHGANSKLCTVGLAPIHSAPFVSIEHEGPHSVMSAIEPAPASIAGVHALLYILRGSATVWHANSTPDSFAGVRLRAGEGALLDARHGAILRMDPTSSSTFEALRVLIRAGESKHIPKSREIMVSRALPAYAVKDEKSGTERAHVRVLVGSTSPIDSARCVRNTLRSLLTVENANELDNAYNVGVYDVRIAPGEEIRLRLRSSRAHIYIRESSLRIGHRVVTRGHLAVLHGCETGCVTLRAIENDTSASCFVFEGESAAETIHTNGDGLVAVSARGLRKLERKRRKGAFGKFSDKLYTVLQELEQEGDEDMTPV